MPKSRSKKSKRSKSSGKPRYRLQVWNGTRARTPGGLTKADLFMKNGRIKSRAASAAAKKKFKKNPEIREAFAEYKIPKKGRKSRSKKSKRSKRSKTSKRSKRSKTSKRKSKRSKKGSRKH